MRKIIRFFLNYILVSGTTVNVIACRWGCTNDDYDLADKNEQDISCNCIVPDIDKRINKIVSDRMNNGTDVASLKQWYLRSSENWFNKTSRKLEFVTNLEEKIQYQAKKESINAFNLLADNKNNFADFYDLQNRINHTNLGKIYANVNWNTLINSLAISNYEKDEIRDELVRFYNIFAQIYGRNNVLKLLYRMAKINKNNLFAFVESRYVYDSQFRNYSLVQVMAINPNSLSRTTQYWQYFNGYKASKSIIRTIVHEYGHALGSFIRLNFQERQKINSLADNDPNKWWNNYFNSSYLLKNNLEKEKINDETKYMILSLTNGTKINDPIYQKLLAYGIVRSEYGRESHFELFAEAFDQWIDTEENQRNIAWEKLDKFFRIDLPKVL